MVRRIDETIERAFGEHGIGEERVPLRWRPVRGHVVLARGRTPFRTADLVSLVALVRELSARKRQADSAGNDKEIMP